ncbi:TetR/AcrR family transcriptional regulator [Nocardioides sp. Root614]|uniref:TetR/AcrR family transcriptional regulator n=1 Tax=Nocardioides sp. Root614 TaxID=1736571 RepID=UPI001F2500AC|nr:TetR/AcrR family transcriptional regulator [Nocardioides sp. Root614]
MDTPAATGSLLERAFAEVTDRSGDDGNADVLDAACELFSAHGIQRTTMDDVARRAGLSRITVYRRISSKEALVEQVVLREFRRYLDQFFLDIAHAETLEERLVCGFVSSLRSIRSNALIGGLMVAEPQALVPMLETTGRTLAVVSQFVAGQLRQEQAAGHVDPDVDIDMVAEVMVRLTTSFLLTPSDQVDLDDDEQVGDVARRYLVPMLGMKGRP